VKTAKNSRRAKRTTTRPQSKSTDWTWVAPKSLKVNPDFKRLIPLQSREEYLALSESIKAEGCRDPLLVWKGHNVVLDGHTRRELCSEHGKQVKVREVELADKKAATEFILQIQRQRRNLTREAMSYFRGTEYNAIKQSHGGSRRGRTPSGQTDPMKKTAETLAERYGVSEKTIRRDGMFAQIIDKIADECGDPEAKRKLLGADVKLTHGLARFLSKQEPEERKAAIKQLIELGELPRVKKRKRSGAHQTKQVAQALVSRLKSKGDEHALAVLEQMARLLGREVSGKPAKGDKAAGAEKPVGGSGEADQRGQGKGENAAGTDASGDTTASSAQPS
jgi:hypothetical protein